MTLRITFLLIIFTCLTGKVGLAQSQMLHGEFFFRTASSTLQPDEYSNLERWIAATDTLQVARITISAWCDDVGDNRYNERLSEKRADEIKQLLIKLSIPGNMIETTGNGEVALTTDQPVEQTRAHNRRADVMVSYRIKQTEKEKIVAVPEEKTVKKKESPLSDDQKVGDKITLENILFIGRRHVLLPESYPALEKLTATLLEKKKYHIIILGHICCVQDGKDGLDFDTGLYNLSVARAQAIYNYLVAHGVADDRLEFKGMKHDYPTGLGDRQDRRVEIEIAKIADE